MSKENSECLNWTHLILSPLTEQGSLTSIGATPSNMTCIMSWELVWLVQMQDCQTSLLLVNTSSGFEGGLQGICAGFILFHTNTKHYFSSLKTNFDTQTW